MVDVGGNERPAPFYLNEQVMQVTVKNGDEQVNFGRQLPVVYREAFADALKHPIVQLGFADGIIGYAVTRTVPQDDAHYNPRNGGGLLFAISDGKATLRPFQTAGDVESAVVHETIHGFTETWYRFYRAGVSSGDPVLDQHIADLHKACADLRDAVYRQYVTEHRAEMAQSFTAAAANFTNTATVEVATDPQTAEAMLKYATGMQSAAAAVTTDALATYQGLEGPVCSLPRLIDVERAVAAPGSVLTPTIAERPEMQPVAAAERNLETGFDKAYGCIKDGNALRDAYHPDTASPVGHAFEDPNEAVSSIMAILAENPRYLPACMSSMEIGQQQVALGNVIRAVIMITGYTHPDLIQVLNQDPQTVATIKQLS